MDTGFREGCGRPARQFPVADQDCHGSSQVQAARAEAKAHRGHGKAGKIEEHARQAPGLLLRAGVQVIPSFCLPSFFSFFLGSYFKALSHSFFSSSSSSVLTEDEKALRESLEGMKRDLSRSVSSRVPRFLSSPFCFFISSFLSPFRLFPLSLFAPPSLFFFLVFFLSVLVALSGHSGILSSSFSPSFFSLKFPPLYFFLVSLLFFSSSLALRLSPFPLPPPSPNQFQGRLNELEPLSHSTSASMAQNPRLTLKPKRKRAPASAAAFSSSSVARGPSAGGAPAGHLGEILVTDDPLGDIHKVCVRVPL